MGGATWADAPARSSWSVRFSLRASGAGQAKAQKTAGPGDRVARARRSFEIINGAATYSPTRSPGQYHRRWRA